MYPFADGQLRYDALGEGEVGVVAVVLRIELDGSLAGSTMSGLMVSAGDSTIRGLTINRFDYFGVVFNSPMLWLETLDALLRPTEGVPVKVPAELRKLHKEEETFWA